MNTEKKRQKHKTSEMERKTKYISPFYVQNIKSEISLTRDLSFNFKFVFYLCINGQVKLSQVNVNDRSPFIVFGFSFILHSFISFFPSYFIPTTTKKKCM